MEESKQCGVIREGLIKNLQVKCRVFSNNLMKEHYAVGTLMFSSPAVNFFLRLCYTQDYPLNAIRIIIW